MKLTQAIRESRLVRWAAIAIAINVLSLPRLIADHVYSAQTVSLMIPAADVTPMFDAQTRQLATYRVAHIPVEEVAIWTRWPSFASMYGLLGINIALLAWILRLAILEFKFIVGETQVTDVRLPSRKGDQKPPETLRAEE